MGQARRQLEHWIRAIDLPTEILTGIPTVQIKGREETVVVQHRGILSYSDDAVDVASSIGVVRIRGAGLKIRLMNRERVCLCGKVSRVELEESPV